MSKLSREEKRRKKEEAKQAKAERKARQDAVKSDGSLLISMLIVLLVLVGIWNFAMVGVIGFSYTRAARERTAALSQSVPPAASQSTLSAPSGNSPGGATGISTPVNTPAEPAATPEETSAPEPTQDEGSENSPSGGTLGANQNQSEQDRLEETLRWQIEAAVSNKFDGYQIEFNEDDIHVSVWRESISNTVKLLQENGKDSTDDDWVWLKNNTKNTSDYIYDCIETSEFKGTSLIFDVLDHSTQETLLLTIVDEEIVFDIMSQ